jgi:hypothetical protein
MSRVLGAAGESAKTGEKLAGRFGVAGAVGGAAVGVYYAPEISKFKDNLKDNTCGSSK